MFRIKMFRDRIVLNAQLKTYLMDTLAKPAPAGQQDNRKILLAAREITIQDGYTFDLPECDLVMVADDYDTSKGTVKLSVPAIPADGKPGLPGRTLSIVCKNWKGGTSFSLKGGAGGKGLRGATGTPGKNGTPSATGKDGGDGGKGGTGFTGGTGGKGGELYISHVSKQVGNIIYPLLMVPGGDGGPGGPGGFGGAGGEGVEWCKPNGTFCVMGTNGKQGPLGNTGAAGATGTSGSVTVTALAARYAYKNALLAVEVPLKEWSDYRFVMGEYFFRAFGYQNPTYFKLAQNELEWVIAMDPTNAAATVYRSQLFNNQNILGLSRNADIIPDFSRYEEVYTQYHGIVNTIFQASMNMLLNNVSLSQKKKDLEREINNFTGMIDALGDDLNTAIIGKTIADKEVVRAAERIDDIRKRIAERKEELENPEVDLFGIIIGVVGAIVSVIAAIPTMGTSLVGAATSIAVIFDAVESAGVGGIITQATDPDADQTELDALKKEAKGLKGFIEGVAKGVSTVISFVKMMQDVEDAEIEDEEYRSLIREAIELAHQQLIAQMHQSQAGFALQAAQKRYTQAIANKAAAQLQLSGLSTDIKVLETASLNMVKMAQHYMNILTKYAFFAARALEIYTLVDKSKDIRFDYGYIHPDKEANYKEGITPLSSLITYYQQSWNTFASLLNYKQQYDNYFEVGSWVYDYHKVSITDTALLNHFKSKAELYFSVDLTDLPSSRYEAKAETVYVALIGATSNSDAVTTIVEHSGRYAEKKRNGKIIEAVLKPRKGVVIAKQTALSSDIGVLGGSEPGIDFWGRGLAADWCLSIEKDELINANVNLANVTQIQVWFVYQSFLVSAAAQKSQSMIKDGMLIEDEAGKLYVTYGGAKMSITDRSTLQNLGLERTVVDRSVTQELISALPIIPKNNTILRAQPSRKIYVINKGVKMEVGSTDTLDKMGRHAADIKDVPETALDLLPYGGVAH